MQVFIHTCFHPQFIRCGLLKKYSYPGNIMISELEETRMLICLIQIQTLYICSVSDRTEKSLHSFFSEVKRLSVLQGADNILYKRITLWVTCRHPFFPWPSHTVPNSVLPHVRHNLDQVSNYYSLPKFRVINNFTFFLSY